MPFFRLAASLYFYVEAGLDVLHTTIKTTVKTGNISRAQARKEGNMSDKTGINYGVIETECNNLNKHAKHYSEIAQDVKKIHDILQDWDGEEARAALPILLKVNKELGEIDQSIGNIAKWGHQVSDNFREAENAGKKAYNSFA